MSEKPILFSAPMVRAILAGRKTQTRRVLGLHTVERPDGYVHCYRLLRGDDSIGTFVGSIAPNGQFDLPMKYGQPGDRLYVKETHVFETSVEYAGEPLPHQDGRPHRLHDDDGTGEGSWWEQPHYRATDPAPELTCERHDGPCCHWRPSIFMPRWASRITLDITAVRIERLQDITEEDAEAEGVDADEHMECCGNGVWDGPYSPPGCCGDPIISEDYVSAFRRLWDSINGKRDGCSWSDNSYVWVVEWPRYGLGEAVQRG